MIVDYHKQTTPLLGTIHGLSGVVRTGESRAVRNFMTVLWLHGGMADVQAEIETALSNVHSGDRVDLYEPIVYRFTVGRGRWQRDMAAVHGMIDKRVGMVWQQQFKLIVVMEWEVRDTLKTVFKVKL